MFGAIWGVPWMESAAQAVTALGRQYEVVQMLARIGIVLAVGVDGVWIMLTIHGVMFPSYRTKLKLCRSGSSSRGGVCTSIKSLIEIRYTLLNERLVAQTATNVREFGLNYWA
jgi:hypothetical protein